MLSILPRCLLFLHYTALFTYEPPHQKTNNLHMRKQRRRPASRSPRSWSAPLFSLYAQLVQFPCFLNPKSQAPSLNLRLYRLVCIGPGQKPQRTVFLCCGSYTYMTQTPGINPRHLPRTASVTVEKSIPG